MVDEDMVQRQYCYRQLSAMRRLCARFYTCGQSRSALDAALLDRDDFANAVRFAAGAQSPADLGSVTAGNLDDEDADWWSLATIKGVTFLREFLPADAYRALFEALQRAPVDGHPRSTALRCRALSGAAYGAAVEGRLDRAAVPAAAAYDLLPSVDDDTRAFCLYCLAVVCRQSDSTKAESLARRSLEIYRGLQQAPCAWSPPERIRLGSMHDPEMSAFRGWKPPLMGVNAIRAASEQESFELTCQVGAGSMHDPNYTYSASKRVSTVGMGIVYSAELLASILADAGTIALCF